MCSKRHTIQCAISSLRISFWHDIRLTDPVLRRIKHTMLQKIVFDHTLVFLLYCILRYEATTSQSQRQVM